MRCFGDWEALNSMCIRCWDLQSTARLRNGNAFLEILEFFKEGCQIRGNNLHFGRKIADFGTYFPHRFLQLTHVRLS